MSVIDVLKYHYAVVSSIPNSFPARSNRLSKNEDLDINLAARQHTEYVEILRKLGIDVLELPADDRHDKCVFVADIAVVINGTALICRPEDSRLGEVS